MSESKSTFKRWDRWRLAIAGGIGIASPLFIANIARGTMSPSIIMILLVTVAGVSAMAMFIMRAEDDRKSDRE